MPAVTARLRPYVPWVSIAVVLLLVAGVIGYLVTPGTPMKTLTADFSEAPGLYVGNHVDVLGIPVGTVTAIKPEPGYVAVTMHVRKSLSVPADADAILMAPEVVADRFVQLEPAYTGGPTIAANAVIPASRTGIPESVDAIFATLNDLAEQLGPNGVNKTGALTDFVSELAKQIGPVGPDFHGAVVNFSQALHTIASYSPQLAGLLDNLGGLSQALATNSNTYQSFAADLTSVSALLANNRSQISSVLSALQELFANLTTFIDNNGSTLKGSIDNLDSLASTLASQQAALAESFDLTPLSLENLDNAIDKSAPGGPAIRSRYDPMSDTQGLFNTVCGNASLRFLVILATATETNPLTVATPQDTLCAVGNALTALTPPPGSAPGPDLTLGALVP